MPRTRGETDLPERHSPAVSRRGAQRSGAPSRGVGTSAYPVTMPIVPDTKDWTWVLDRPCPQCGFEAGGVTLAELPGLIETNAAAWQPVLARGDVRTRPDDSTWSALEYSAHVRDVFRLFAVRLELMLAQDDPEFANWDQDAAAIEDRYNEQDPAQVALELAAAAAAAANAFGSVRDDQSGRTGRRSDGSRFTVVTLAQYFIHDPVHHLWDVAHEHSDASVV